MSARSPSMEGKWTFPSLSLPKPKLPASSPSPSKPSRPLPQPPTFHSSPLVTPSKRQPPSSSRLPPPPTPLAKRARAHSPPKRSSPLTSLSAHNPPDRPHSATRPVGRLPPPPPVSFAALVVTKVASGSGKRKAPYALFQPHRQEGLIELTVPVVLSLQKEQGR